MENFAVYYIEANVVCSLLFGILLFHNHFNIDRQERQIKFDYVLIAFILYFLTDCLWAAIVSGMVPKTRFSVVLNSLFQYATMGGTIYCWLDYVIAYEKLQRRSRAINRYVVLAPFVLSAVALILHYIIAPQTLINEAQETMPAFGLYLTVVPDICIVLILFYTIRKARSEKNRGAKRKHLFLGAFPLIVTVGGLIETAFFPYIPIYCYTCLILIVVFYIQSIMGQVSLDALTNINNRGQLTRYTGQKSNIYQEGRQTIAVMMVIDNFKTINDTYGHAEGDRALVKVADSMKKVMNRQTMPMFLGRYGGDEFIMIVHPQQPAPDAPRDGTKNEAVEQLISEIRAEVETNEMTYPLSVSAGYAEMKGGEDTIDQCIERADCNLYLDKKRRKVGRR